jgi:hypothetical protein
MKESSMVHILRQIFIHTVGGIIEKSGQTEDFRSETGNRVYNSSPTFTRRSGRTYKRLVDTIFFLC